MHIFSEASDRQARGQKAAEGRVNAVFWLLFS